MAVCLPSLLGIAPCDLLARMANPAADRLATDDRTFIVGAAFQPRKSAIAAGNSLPGDTAAYDYFAYHLAQTVYKS
jgi:hypothetical protein